MPEQYVLQQKPLPPVPDEVETKKISRPLLIGGIVGAFLIVFVLGLLLGRTPQDKKPSQIVPASPTTFPTEIVEENTSLTPTPVSEIPLVQFLPNKQYFDDTYVAIQRDAPHAAIVLSTSRVEQQQNFVEYTKVNYFDGQAWNRKTVTTTVPSSDIKTNSLLRSWTNASEIDQNQSSPPPLAEVQLPTGSITFTSTNLQNEISLQSLPGSTKFIYQGLGSITIKGDTTPAYVFYSRTYSFNAVDLAFLAHPENLTSNWFLFWDKENTFYYLDNHNVPGSTNPIQNFQIGVRETFDHSIVRTPEVNAGFQKDNQLSYYEATFNTPVNERVLLPEQNVINKADTKAYQWIMELGEGKVIKREGRTVLGVGLVEYIRQGSLKQ